MSLQLGSRLGPYEVTALIGVGGMGEVYRATDTNLGRQVAIKVLPEAFAHDPDRLARFEREAKTLASLNHPNIAQIHGLEKTGGMTALVMELVEGPTLADRIAQAAIPIDEALPIAKQIAEALEAAHGQGIIHRDLKPANIKVRADGTVKVLDFGLAKAIEPTGALSPSMSQAPTITTPAMMTGAGIVLGTAAYMSPEQARGKPVDKRDDIWAFGCVLYEMLTGNRAFPGEDMSEVLASVLAREPDWARLPVTLSPTRATYIRRCLHKDLRQRIHDIADVRLALEGAFETTDQQAAVPVAVPQSRRVALVGAAALLVGACVTAAAAWIALPSSSSVPPRVSRWTLAASGSTALTIGGISRDLTITPDGSRIVYVGNRNTQLFVRALDALEPVAVFTGAPRGPFVSPDSQWIGFVDGNLTLKKVSVTGGPALTVARVDGRPTSATWGPDDTIILATQDAATGLLRVTAAGGPTSVLTRPDGTKGELDHLWPEMLPGGRAVLFTITAVAGGLDGAQLAVLDLQTGKRTVLLHGGSHAHYVRSGHLVYTAAGTLRAVPFDLATLQTRGNPVPVIADVVTTFAGGVDAAVADDGTLTYVSGGGVAGLSVPRTLVWVDRQAREMVIPSPPRPYLYPRLSPDGGRVAVTATDREFDIWLWDFSRTTLTRATVDPAVDNHPAWTSDGRRVIFSSERSGTRNLYWQDADGIGMVERLTESPNLQNAGTVSPDGRHLIFTETTPQTAADVMQVELNETRRVTSLVQSPFSERNGIVSPDGRWLAYEADNSGRFEISVRPFPDVNGGHWQVSTGGGTRPLWARNGQELFYVSPAGAVMRVGVQRATSWASTTPTLLVKEGYFTIPSVNPGRTYDIAPDGQRFLMIKEGDGSESTSVPSQIIIVQNWFEELKRLVPTN